MDKLQASLRSILDDDLLTLDNIRCGTHTIEEALCCHLRFYENASMLLAVVDIGDVVEEVDAAVAWTLLGLNRLKDVTAGGGVGIDESRVYFSRAFYVDENNLEDSLSNLPGYLRQALTLQGWLREFQQAVSNNDDIPELEGVDSSSGSPPQSSLTESGDFSEVASELLASLGAPPTALDRHGAVYIESADQSTIQIRHDIQFDEIELISIIGAFDQADDEQVKTLCSATCFLLDTGFCPVGFEPDSGTIFIRFAAPFVPVRANVTQLSNIVQNFSTVSANWRQRIAAILQMEGGDVSVPGSASQIRV